MESTSKKTHWLSRGIVGILLATFFADVGHEMATAVLPIYLAAVGLGPFWLGVMEGVSDLLRCLCKFAGGMVGHRTEKRHGWATLGYLATAGATGAMGLVRSVPALISLRSLAWCGRGFRSPLRDFLLADEVEKTHYGRAYGIERSADMLGAVLGPLVAAILIWLKCDLKTIILASLIPSMISVFSFAALVRDRHAHEPNQAKTSVSFGVRALPKSYWFFVAGVFLFGLGDFSRTFLILLVVRATPATSVFALHGISTAVMLYVIHNLISGVVAYPVGSWGDRMSKLALLVGGYAIGVATNALLAFESQNLGWLATAIVFSGIYIAVSETLEKAVAADLLPRDLRSMGLGILAAANAAGDMVSSIFVGWRLERGDSFTAFAIPAAVGFAGIIWILIFAKRMKLRDSFP